MNRKNDILTKYEVYCDKIILYILYFVILLIIFVIFFENKKYKKRITDKYSFLLLKDY